MSPAAEWISVSPHASHVVQQSGQELKVVPGLNGLSLADVEVMTAWPFQHRFVQPLSGDRASIVACLAFVRTHPGWRLCSQAHKAWGIA